MQLVSTPAVRRFSVFDYTITITRKHRYLVVGCPEFGIHLATVCLDSDRANAEGIGRAVLQVLGQISGKLRECELEGRAQPRPSSQFALFSREVISAKDASRILGVSRATLRRMVYDRRLRAERTPGGHFRFLLSDLADYLATRSGQGAA